MSEQVLEAGDGGGGMSSLSEVSLLSPHFKALAADPKTSDDKLFFSPLPLPPLLLLLLPLPPLLDILQGKKKHSLFIYIN